MRSVRVLYLASACLCAVVLCMATTALGHVAAPWDNQMSLSAGKLGVVSGRHAAGVSAAMAPGDPVNFDAALTAAGNYLRHMQADITEDNAGNGIGAGEVPKDPDDGGWDWVVTSPPEPFFHTTAASPKNLYGVTGVGLYYAYLRNGDPAYFTAMTDAANVMIADAGIRSSSDLAFLMLYNDLPGVVGTAYKDAAKAKFDARITLYGSATALAVYVRDTRGVTQGYPNGIIGWDLGGWAKAAAMLAARYPLDPYSYATASSDIAEVAWQDSFNSNPGLFDVVADAGWDPTWGNVNYWWYTLGISGLIEAFVSSGTHTAEIPELVARIVASQYPNGAVSGSYGANATDEDWQSTAYAAPALAAVDLATYQTRISHMAYWVGATQDPSGGWKYGDNSHYPEVGGECASALALGIPPENVIVDDNFFSQTDVDVYNAAHGTNFVWGYDAFNSVQAGVNAVSGSTVNVLAGTYEEQVEITKPVNLIGAGLGVTIIRSPSVLTKSYVTSAANKPVIFVHGADGVAISNLTVDGYGRGNGNYRFQGIAYYNAGGSVDNCEVKDVRETPISGTQHGVGIYAYVDAPTPRTVDVSNCHVHGFQKGGITLNGVGLTAHATGNKVDGYGPAGFIAMNGIQIGFGGTGTIANNQVSGCSYTGPGWSSAGLLLYNPTGPIVSNGNLIQDCQIGINYIGTGGTIEGNTVNATTAGTGVSYFWNIVADPGKGTPHQPPPQPFDNELATTSGTKGVPTSQGMQVIATVIYRNVVDGGGGGAGIEADALGTETLNVTATENVATNFDAAMVLYKDPGATLNATVRDNAFTSSTYGFYNMTGTAQDVRANWWGDLTGPKEAATNATGMGSEISGSPTTGDVLYSPWLGMPDADLGTMGYQAAAPMLWGMNSTSTLQDTHDAFAASGDEVRMREGTYNGATDVTKTLTITKLDASRPLLVGASNVIEVLANNVTLSGLEITGGNGVDPKDPGSNCFGVVLGDNATAVNGVRITDCDIHSNDNGIRFWSTSGCRVDHNLIHGNNMGSCGPGNGAGILLWSVSGIEDNDANEIDYNQIYDQSRMAIFCGGWWAPVVNTSDGNNIHHNEMWNNMYCAADGGGVIQLMGANNNQVHDNKIHDNAGNPGFQYGFYLVTQSSGNQIYNNRVNDNKGGIAMWNFQAGTACDNNVIRNNIFAANGPSIDARVINPAAGTVSGNRFYGNSFANALNANSSAPVNFWDDGTAIGNCWSDFAANSGFPTQYNVPGSAAQVDNHPNTGCGLVFSPNDILYHCGQNFTFDVSIGDAVLDMKSAHIVIEYPASLVLVGISGLSPNYSLSHSLVDNIVGNDILTVDLSVLAGSVDGPAPLLAVKLNGTASLCSGSMITMTTGDLLDPSSQPILASLAPPITVADKTPPVFTVCPPSLSSQCVAQAPTCDPSQASATDDCDPDVTITCSRTDNSGAGCPGNPLVYTDTYTATDECGNSAQCQRTITVIDNTAPDLAGCPTSLTIECDVPVPPPAAVTATDNCDGALVPVFVETPNLTGCGAGYTGTITRKWTATDRCGNAKSCQQVITIVDTKAPVITAWPPDLQIQGLENLPPCDGAGVAASDNCDPTPVISCSRTNVGGVGCGSLPVQVVYTYTATDDCGNVSAARQRTVTVTFPPCNFSVSVGGPAGTVEAPLGAQVSVPVRIDSVGAEIGRFDFAFAYDASAASLLTVSRGEAIADWKVFTYRLVTEGETHLVRLTAVADPGGAGLGDPAYKPAGPVAYLQFALGNDYRFVDQPVTITPYPTTCAANCMISRHEDASFIAADADAGACAAGLPGAVVPAITFSAGSIHILEPTQRRGDINLNGVAYEVGDAVLFVNYLVSGMGVLSPDPVRRAMQIEAADVNNDGVALGVADLIYLTRVITGDIPPMAPGAKWSPYLGTVTASVQTEEGTVHVSTQAAMALGGAFFTFRYSGLTVGEPVLSAAAAGLQVKSQAEHGVLKVLVYAWDRGAQVDAGAHELFTLPFSGDGVLELVGAEAADASGSALAATLAKSAVPTDYALQQNYPNPFNAGTMIAFTLPRATDWTLAVYNIAGQTVRTFAGRDGAGTVAVSWDGTDQAGTAVASGIYFYRVSAGSFNATRKMTLLK